MVEQINAKLSQGYSFVGIFRMIIDGYLCKEDETNGAISRIETKKYLFSSLLNIMNRPRFGRRKLYNEQYYPLIEDQDVLILFFTKSEIAKQRAKEVGISDGHISLRISFDEYCDTIASLVQKYPEMELFFCDLFRLLLLISYSYFDVLRIQDTIKREYKGKMLDYTTYINKKISNYEKQKNGDASDHAKAKRRLEMEREFGFTDSALNFDDQIKYYKSMTKKSNQQTFVFDFMRDSLVCLLKTVRTRESDWHYYVDLFELIPFLNPKKYFMSEKEIDDSEYTNANDYKYKNSKKFFGDLSS